MLHFSNSPAELEVFIKEGTINYIEDSKVFIINVTSVKISTYNDSGSPAGFATIYSIDESVPKISERAAFHLMKDTSVSLSSVVAGQGFSDYEIAKIGLSGAAFEVTRSSITLDHIIARRVAASKDTGVFLYLIYLQSKTMELTNVEFHVTGSIITTNDPIRIIIDNVKADTYNVKSVFDLTIGCNYPEAILSSDVKISNFTIFTIDSSEVADFRPPAFVYSGPGNFSGYNWNITTVYNLASSGTRNFLFLTTAE